MAQTHQVVLLGEGGRVDHTPGADVATGDAVITNGMFQFATQPILSGKLGTLLTAGGPPLIKIFKVNGAISVGNALYWDASGNPEGGTSGTGAVTTTVTGNTLFGRCVKAAASGDETVEAEMTIGVVTANTLVNAIADPGDGNAIPVTQSGYVALVTTGAETRTLAAPTFSDTGEMQKLVAVEEGANLRWREVANDGAALSTV